MRFPFGRSLASPLSPHRAAREGSFSGTSFESGSISDLVPGVVMDTKRESTDKLGMQSVESKDPPKRPSAHSPEKAIEERARADPRWDSEARVGGRESEGRVNSRGSHNRKGSRDVSSLRVVRVASERSMSSGADPDRPYIAPAPGKKNLRASSTRNLAFGSGSPASFNAESTLSDGVDSPRSLRALAAFALGHPATDISVGVLILLNSIMLGVTTNHMAENNLLVPPDSFRNMETSFCFLFTLEIVTRMYVVGLRTFFLGGDWHWNMFDFIIVGMQFIDELAAASGVNAMPANMSFARVLKLLKMIRVARVARVARVLRELRTLVASIVGSMKNLFWCGILLLLMVYMAGIFLTSQVSDYRLTNDVSIEQELRLLRFYGNLPLSMLSLFEAITGGVDWNDLVRPLMEEISPSFAILYVIYIAFSTMCLMNVVTGVFVDSVLVRAKYDREQFLVRNASEILSEGGEMNLEQFLSKVETPQMQEFFKAIDANASEAARLFSVVDLDQSGLVDAEEFLSGCLKLHGPAKALDTAILVQLVHDLGKEFTKWNDSQARVIRSMSQEKTKDTLGEGPSPGLRPAGQGPPPENRRWELQVELAG